MEPAWLAQLQRVDKQVQVGCGRAVAGERPPEAPGDWGREGTRARLSYDLGLSGVPSVFVP